MVMSKANIYLEGRTTSKKKNYFVTCSYSLRVRECSALVWALMLAPDQGTFLLQILQK